MLAGRVRSIWRYPVKSLRGSELEESDVRADGLPGDRAVSLIVSEGHARIGKAYRGKEHDRLHLTQDPAAAVQLAKDRGVRVHAVPHDDGHDFDAAPVSLIFDRWLEDVSAHIGYPIEYQRFRPNLFVEAAPGFTEREEALVGHAIEIGDVRLIVRKTIGRCVAVTYHPDGEPADAEILRYVAQERNNVMGVYCDVEREGNVRNAMPVLIDL